MRKMFLLLLACVSVSSYASKVTCYLPGYIFTTTGAVIINPYNYRVTANNGKNYFVPINNCIVEW